MNLLICVGKDTKPPHNKTVSSITLCNEAELANAGPAGNGHRSGKCMYYAYHENPAITMFTGNL